MDNKKQGCRFWSMIKRVEGCGSARHEKVKITAVHVELEEIGLGPDICAAA